jgi:hypothetical protein
MTQHSHSLTWIAYPAIFGAPWLLAIVWYWRRRPSDGAVPASMGQQALTRLSARI